MYKPLGNPGLLVPAQNPLATQASTEFAPQLDYRLRRVGGVPVLEEHSAAGGGDPADGPAARQQAGAVTEINPVLPAERLATQCHQDAVLALASVEVRVCECRLRLG